MNNKEVTIIIKNIPESYLKGMHSIMKTGKFKIESEIISPPQDEKYLLDFKDIFTTPLSMQLMNSILSSAFTLWTFNPDGKKTPKIDI